MTMVSAYPLRPLGEMSENHDARRIPVKAADRKPGPYPYYGAQGIVDYVDDYIFEGLFVLVAEDGENLRTRNQDIAFMAGGKFWVNNHAHILRASSAAATRFLQYAINSTDISGYITGSTIPKLSQRSLNSILIPCPTPTEQEKIVSLLGALDDKIELNRRMNETLEAMARAIFKDWFVDFGPTRAKGEGRAPYLAPGIWDLFPDVLNDEDRPTGWTLEPLQNLADVNWGDTKTTKKSYSEAGYTAYSASGPDGFLPYFDYERTGVVLSAIGANCGLTWLARGKWSCIKNTIRFWSTNDYLPTEYLFLATRGADFWPKRGSAQPFISQGDSRRIQIVVPAPLISKVFGELVTPLFEGIDKNLKETTNLAKTRDLLLPKLMSGEIRLADAEQAVEAVA